MGFTEDIIRDSKVDWRLYKQFYLSEDFKPLIPKYSSWRHYRVRSADGVFRKVRMTIRDKKDLVRALLRYAAIDVYYSVACWLNPQNKASKVLDGRKGSSYVWADNLLLGSDLYFDLDAGKPLDIEGMEVARKEALYLAERYPRLNYIQFTGAKGFGVDFKTKMASVPNPADRVAQWTSKRKLLIDRLLSSHQMSSLDKSTSLDLLRVRRLPGTPNSKTGYVSNTITLQELRDKTVKEILSDSHRVGRGRTTTESPARQQANDEPPRLQSGKAKPAAGDRPGPRSSAIFLSSTDTYRPKRQVIFLQYPKGKHKEIQHLQSTYKLGLLYHFTTQECDWFASIKTMDDERVGKVFRASKAINKTTFFKYKKSYIPIDVEYAGFIPGEYKEPYSTAHKAHFQTLSGERTKPSGTLQFTKIIYKEMPGGE